MKESFEILLILVDLYINFNDGRVRNLSVQLQRIHCLLDTHRKRSIYNQGLKHEGRSIFLWGNYIRVYQ